jgi:hypothetical protein
MAEVKQIPSGVGAFEAQVFDFSSITRQLAQQQAAQRKAQQEAKKEADKTLAELSSLKAAGRSQDLEYLSGLKDGLTNFFSQNREKIQPGTAEYNKYNELKTNFIYETEKSKNEKEKEARFATYASANASKMRLSDSAKEIIEIQKLPINDQRRSQYKKKFEDREAGIDELDLPDLDKFSIFDETQLQRNIKASPSAVYNVKDVEFNKNFKGLKSPYPITITGTTKITDPFTVIREYTTEYAQTPDVENTYSKEFNRLTDVQKEVISEEMKAMRDVFKAAGAGEFKFEDDNTAGVSNAFEYGLYVNLKRNLPRDLGETVSTAVGNLFKVRAYGRGASAQKGIPIDNEMANQVKSGKADWNYWKNEFNQRAGQKSEAAGIGIAPYEMINMNEGRSTVLLRTFVKDYSLNKDGELVSDEKIADSLLPQGKVLKRDDYSGFYYYETYKTYNFRPDENPNYQAEIEQAWVDAKEAQYDIGQKQSIERSLKLQTEAGGLGPGKAGRK